MGDGMGEGGQEQEGGLAVAIQVISQAVVPKGQVGKGIDKGWGEAGWWLQHKEKVDLNSGHMES